MPEIDIARIRYANVYENGAIYLSITLTELTEQATLEAVEMLKNNQYVESVNPCMTGGSGVWEGPIVALRGDLDGDRQITNSDLVRLAMFIVCTDDNRAYLMKTADMNKDWFITNLDLVMLARRIVNQA